MPQSRFTVVLTILIGTQVWALQASAASTWSSGAGYSYERTTELTGTETSHDDTIEQAYSLSFATDLLETLEFSLDLTLDIEETDEVPGYTTRDTTPAVDVALVAEWWDVSASWEETKTTSTDPATVRTVDMEWEVEFVAVPEFDPMPSLSFTVEGGNDDVVDRDLDVSIEHTFLDMLDISLGISRETTDEPEENADTDGRTIETEVSFDRDLTEAIKFEASWESDRDQVLLVTQEDEILAREDTLENDVQVLIAWNILDLLEFSLEREIEWDKDLEQDTLEVTDTWVGEVEYDIDFTDTVGLRLSYSDEREDDRPLGSNKYTITKDYTAEMRVEPFEFLTLTPSFDRTDKVEWVHEAGAETFTSIEDSIEIQFDYTFWKDVFDISINRTWDKTTELGTATKHEHSWEFDITFKLFNIPELELSPEYGYTRDQDLIANKTEEEEVIELDIDYSMSLGEVTTLDFAHTYSRKQKFYSDKSGTIERADDTDLTLTLEDFLVDMSTEWGMTRSAKDTSGDDKGPEVDYAYSVTYDWDILPSYVLSFEYNYDIKGASEDSQDFTTTFTANLFNDQITLDLEHEFEEQLEGERKETHSYLIEVQGEF